LRARDRPLPDAHPARLILTLSLTATVGLGIGRFAYALVLPDMRDSLRWSYSAAGFMNTINSAVLFGVTFFAVVGSTTAFVRFNYPPEVWPTAIAAITISFGVGQTLGPIAVGAITDALGSLSYALNVSAALLALGALAALCQRKVGPPV
jgi:predicted MFS family arabinose efflux permease